MMATMTNNPPTTAATIIFTLGPPPESELAEENKIIIRHICQYHTYSNFSLISDF